MEVLSTCLRLAIRPRGSGLYNYSVTTTYRAQPAIVESKPTPVSKSLLTREKKNQGNTIFFYKKNGVGEYIYAAEERAEETSPTPHPGRLLTIRSCRN
jgi:hypothetical protein